MLQVYEFRVEWIYNKKAGIGTIPFHGSNEFCPSN